MLTVGQVAENTYIFRKDDSDTALIIDPGHEAGRILATLEQLGISKLEATCSPTPTSTTSGQSRPWLRRRALPSIARSSRRASSRTSCPTSRGRDSVLMRAGTPRRRSPAASIWSSPASRSTSSSPLGTARGTSPTRSRTSAFCSQATSSSRDRSDGRTCHSATGRRFWPRSASSSNASPTRRASIPGTWESQRSARSAPRTRSFKNSPTPS